MLYERNHKIQNVMAPFYWNEHKMFSFLLRRNANIKQQFRFKLHLMKSSQGEFSFRWRRFYVLSGRMVEITLSKIVQFHGIAITLLQEMVFNAGRQAGDILLSKCVFLDIFFFFLVLYASLRKTVKQACKKIPLLCGRTRCKAKQWPCF